MKRTYLLIPILFVISIILHEIGHMIAYGIVGINGDLSYFPPRVTLTSPAQFDLWWDHRLMIALSGGLFSFLLLIYPCYRIHPVATFIAWSELAYGLMEPFYSISRVYAPQIGYDLLLLGIVLILSFTLSALTVIWSWIHEKQ